MGSLSQIYKYRQNPGILIFDLDQKLTYANNEAFDALSGIDTINIQNFSQDQLPSEIFTLCDELKSKFANHQTTDSVYSTVLNHSGILCSLRAFFLKDSVKNQPTHILVMIERTAKSYEIDFENIKIKYNLSKRELEVLKLICNGDGNRNIAEKLFISEYTAKDHIKKIMNKMGVRSRSKVIAMLK